MWHYHPELEIVLTLRGEGYSIVGSSISRYGPGELVLLGSGLPHARYSVPPPGDHLEHIIVQFRPDFCGQQFVHLPENVWWPKLMQRAANGLRVTGETRRSSTETLSHDRDEC